MDSIIKALCEKHGVSFLALFGSAARGEETANSDIDLLVRFEQRISLLDHVRIQRDFSETLGRNVDLVSEGALSPYIRPYIQKDMKVVYERKAA